MPTPAILLLKHIFIYTDRRDYCDHHRLGCILQLSVVVQGTPRIAPVSLDRKYRVPTGNPQAGTSILSGALQPLPPPLYGTVPLLQGTSAAHCHRPITLPTSAVLVPPDAPNPSSASLILPRHRAILYLLIFPYPFTSDKLQLFPPSKDDPSASAHHRRLSSSLRSRPSRRPIFLPTCQSPTVSNGATMDLNTS